MHIKTVEENEIKFISKLFSQEFFCRQTVTINDANQTEFVRRP